MKLPIYQEFCQRITDYQANRISDLDLAEWALKASDRIPDFCRASTEEAALSNFLEQIYQDGPLFPYTHDKGKFDKLISEIHKAITNQRIWKETIHQSIVGQSLIGAKAGSALELIKSAAELRDIQPDKMYHFAIEIEFVGGTAKMGNVTVTF
jgi:hypothetical protein